MGEERRVGWRRREKTTAWPQANAYPAIPGATTPSFPRAWALEIPDALVIGGEYNKDIKPSSQRVAWSNEKNGEMEEGGRESFERETLQEEKPGEKGVGRALQDAEKDGTGEKQREESREEGKEMILSRKAAEEGAKKKPKEKNEISKDARAKTAQASHYAIDYSPLGKKYKSLFSAVFCTRFFLLFAFLLLPFQDPFRAFAPKSHLSFSPFFLSQFSLIFPPPLFLFCSFPSLFRSIFVLL